MIFFIKCLNIILYDINYYSTAYYNRHLKQYENTIKKLKIHFRFFIFLQRNKNVYSIALTH